MDEFLRLSRGEPRLEFGVHLFGIMWNYFGVTGITWNFMEIFGITWKYLEVLEFFENIWK